MQNRFPFCDKRTHELQIILATAPLLQLWSWTFTSPLTSHQVGDLQRTDLVSDATSRKEGFWNDARRPLKSDFVMGHCDTKQLSNTTFRKILGDNRHSGPLNNSMWPKQVPHAQPFSCIEALILVIEAEADPSMQLPVWNMHIDSDDKRAIDIIISPIYMWCIKIYSTNAFLMTRSWVHNIFLLTCLE